MCRGIYGMGYIRLLWATTATMGYSSASMGYSVITASSSSLADSSLAGYDSPASWTTSSTITSTVYHQLNSAASTIVAISELFQSHVISLYNKRCIRTAQQACFSSLLRCADGGWHAPHGPPQRPATISDSARLAGALQELRLAEPALKVTNKASVLNVARLLGMGRMGKVGKPSSVDRTVVVDAIRRRRKELEPSLADSDEDEAEHRQDDEQKDV